MTYKEFEERVRAFSQKHGYKMGVEVDKCYQEWIYIILDSNTSIASVNVKHRYIIGTNWKSFIDIDEDLQGELLDIIVGLAKTPIEEREEKKRFIIPLPGLFTTDGEQQYLTYKDGNYFASRENKSLKQVWKEKDLKYVPTEYKQYAIELQEW